MRSSAVAIVLLAGSACTAGAGDAASTSIELDHEGILETFVIGDPSAESREARASFERACATAATAARTIAGARLVGAACDTPANVSPTTGLTLFGAKATFRFARSGPDAPVVARTTTVIGDAQAYATDAYASWKRACLDEVTRQRSLLGARFIGGGCTGAPTNRLPSSAPAPAMGSEFQAVLAVPGGAPSTLDVQVRGDALGDPSAALASWRTACAAWSADATTRAGEHLVSFDCGGPVATMHGAETVFASSAHIVASGGPATLSTSEGPTALGGGALAEVTALDSVASACTDARALATTLLGPRLIAFGCGAATNLAPSPTTLFRATTPMLALTTGPAKTTIEHFVVGAANVDASDAIASFAHARKAAIRRAVSNTVESRVEGFTVGVPYDLGAARSYVMGAKITLRLGLDTAAVTSARRVRGAADATDTFAAWARACEDAIASAHDVDRERFVGAGCDAPTAVDGAYESNLTVWLLP